MDNKGMGLVELLAELVLLGILWVAFKDVIVETVDAVLPGAYSIGEGWLAYWGIVPFAILGIGIIGLIKMYIKGRGSRGRLGE